MGCAEKDCCTKGASTGAIAFPGTNEPNTPWKLYNHLIAGIPEDVTVRDYCLGTHWSYVEADSGMGVSFTTTGGARRGDLARADGTFNEESQAAKAELAWHIDDAAIARVNAHFDELAVASSCHPERSAEGAESKDASRAPGLLIVDELGRLEIWRGGGLTSAMALLAQGPTAVFPHALAVVRDYLLDDAEILLAEAWPDHCRISPDDTGRAVILSACEFGA